MRKDAADILAQVLSQQQAVQVARHCAHAVERLDNVDDGLVHRADAL